MKNAGFEGKKFKWKALISQGRRHTCTSDVRRTWRTVLEDELERRRGAGAAFEPLREATEQLADNSSEKTYSTPLLSLRFTYAART